MATSEVTISNSAIAILAGSPILVLGDVDSRESVLCESLYPVARDEILEAADWTFAIKRVELAAASEEPVSRWNYKVLLPGEHIRTLGVWTDSDCTCREKYAQEDGYILVDRVPIFLKYIYRVTDPTKFSPLFIRTLYTSLASKLCVPLTEDMKRETALSQQVEFYLDEAATMDGLQGSQERIKSNAFIEVR